VKIVTILFALLLALPASSPAQTTYTYKTVGNLEIKADVYRPAGTHTLPVVVWIHGGALINGHRESIVGGVKSRLLDAECILVSIDYRLAPETQLPHIIDDIEDAFAWIADEGKSLFGADPKRIAVMGSSAGGYLTLTAGFRAKSKPVALVALYGYGDLIGSWYSDPSPHPRHQGVKMTEEEAYRQVSGPPISDARDRDGNGGAFYQYLRQHGRWPMAVSGWDPRKEAEKYHAFMPVQNVTDAWPPTMLIHGTNDTDVPYEQSTMMAEQFRKHGVEHQLITVQDAEHGLSGIDAKQKDEIYRKAVVFVLKKLNAGK
jgi:acetyl esterase/lipase